MKLNMRLHVVQVLFCLSCVSVISSDERLDDHIRVRRAAQDDIMEEIEAHVKSVVQNWATNSTKKEELAHRIAELDRTDSAVHELVHEQDAEAEKRSVGIGYLTRKNFEDMEKVFNNRMATITAKVTEQKVLKEATINSKTEPDKTRLANNLNENVAKVLKGITNTKATFDKYMKIARARRDSKWRIYSEELVYLVYGQKTLPPQNEIDAAAIAKKAAKKKKKEKKEKKASSKADKRMKVRWGGEKASAETFSEKVAEMGPGIEGIKDLIDPEVDWQTKTQKSLELIGSLMAFVPDPAGLIGSAMFSLVGACFGAAAPKTDDYAKLRNEILNAMTAMLDDNMRAEALGEVYRIEFMKNLIDTDKKGNEKEEKYEMTKEEFTTVIQSGAIDAGLTTLGAFRYKMDTYRDRNTILDGRRALDMADIYIKIAMVRLSLLDQINVFIRASGSEANGVGGLTSRFFSKATALTMQDFQYLFWWDDECCLKNVGHFSALVAYNLPIKSQLGKEKPVSRLRQFLKEFRTADFYAMIRMRSESKMQYEQQATDAPTGVKLAVWKKKPLDLPKPKNDRQKLFGDWLKSEENADHLGKYDWKLDNSFFTDIQLTWTLKKDDAKIWIWKLGSKSSDGVSSTRGRDRMRWKLIPVAHPTDDLPNAYYMLARSMGSDKSVRQQCWLYMVLSTGRSDLKTTIYDQRVKDVEVLQGREPNNQILAPVWGQQPGNMFWNQDADSKKFEMLAEMRIMRVRLQGTTPTDKDLFLISPPNWKDDKLYLYGAGGKNAEEVPKQAEYAKWQEGDGLTLAKLRASAWKKFFYSFYDANNKVLADHAFSRADLNNLKCNTMELMSDYRTYEKSDATERQGWVFPGYLKQMQESRGIKPTDYFAEKCPSSLNSSEKRKYCIENPSI